MVNIKAIYFSTLFIVSDAISNLCYDYKQYTKNCSESVEHCLGHRFNVCVFVCHPSLCLSSALTFTVRKSSTSQRSFLMT